MMKSLGTLLTVAAALYVGHLLLQFLIAKDLMDHGNACNAELHFGERINRQLDSAEIDTLFDQYKACLQEKSNAVDRWFGRKLTDEFVEVQRADRQANGPLNARHRG